MQNNPNTITHDSGMSQEEQALFLLGGSECSVCDKPFRDTVVPQPGEKGYRQGRPPEAYDGHICCRTIHCSFCGEPASARCAHLLAQRTGDEHWVFPGIKMQTGLPVFESLGQVWQLLRPTPEEFADCFGDLAPVCARFYESDADPQTIISAYLIERMHWSNTQSIRIEGKGWRYITFAADAAAQRNLVRETLEHVRASFRRWKQKYVPTGIRLARLLPWYISPSYAPGAIGIDATGRYVMAQMDDATAFWDTELPYHPVRIHMETGGERNDRLPQFTNLRFQVAPAENLYRLRYTARTPQHVQDKADVPSDSVHHLEQCNVPYRFQATLTEIIRSEAETGDWTQLLPPSLAPQEFPTQGCIASTTNDGFTLVIHDTATECAGRYHFRAPITHLQAGGGKLLLVVGGYILLWSMVRSSNKTPVPPTDAPY